MTFRCERCDEVYYVDLDGDRGTFSKKENWDNKELTNTNALDQWVGMSVV